MKQKKWMQRKKNILYFSLSICIWILIWQIISIRVDKPIFLPSPKTAVISLTKLCKTRFFWETVAATFYRITKGFLLAIVVGSLLAVLSAFFKPVKFLFSPLLRLIKAIPVASFIILALLWMDSKNLSVLISFMMVLPVIFINVLQGFELVDNRLLEMADIFHLSLIRKIRYIYFPIIFSSFIAACRIGLGFCFKSGIAAEIIGLPEKSIGSALYKAKLYLMTDELFAWTIVIIVGSTLFEGICILLLNLLAKLVLSSYSISFSYKSFIQTDKSNHKEESINSENKIDNSKINLGSKTIDNNNTLTEDMKTLVLQDIHKSFQDHVIFKDFSYSFTNQKIIGIMGDSGIGKTTLLNLIMNLQKPDSGTIEYFHNSNKQKSYKISAVFQEDRLLEYLDASTNILATATKPLSLEEITKHLSEVGLSDVEKKPVSQFSGGMKRRIAIVRAVINPSDILILDEPFNGLDETAKAQTIHYIQKNTANRIVIMVSHDLSELAAMNAKLLHL